MNRRTIRTLCKIELPWTHCLWHLVPRQVPLRCAQHPPLKFFATRTWLLIIFGADMPLLAGLNLMVMALNRGTQQQLDPKHVAHAFLEPAPWNMLFLH